MQFTLNINMDNAAFAETPAAETARILRKLADKITDDDMSLMSDGWLMDYNGNKVGSYLVIDGE